MSKQLIKTMFDIIDEQDWHKLNQVFSMDCVYHRPGFSVLIGLHSIIQFYQSVRSIQRGTHTLTLLLEEGSHVCANGEFSGLLKTGEPTHVEFSDIYELKDGLIASRRTFFFAPLI